MYRRLQHLVRNPSGPYLDANDVAGVNGYIANLKRIFYDTQGDCRVSFAVIEIADTDGYPVGHITWDAEHGSLRFRPSIPDDTQPISLP